MLKKRNSSQITQSAIRNLVANTDLTFFGAGSIAKNIVEAVAREIELLYDAVDLNLSMSRLSTASGAFLDIIAGQFGITRFGNTSGVILAEDRVVRMYVRSGRLVDHLPGSTSGTQGSIPEGTTISTRDNNVTYTVPSQVVVSPSATSVFVPLVPSDPGNGSANNVAAGALVRHSLDNRNILVENLSSLIVSSDPESDDELRLRVSRHVNSRSPGSRTAVMEAAFAFPGVSDIKVHPYKHGAGSFEILVVPTGTRTSPNVLENVSTAVKSVVPYGIRVSVRGPDVLPIGLSIQVVRDTGALRTTAITDKENVRRSLRAYIGSIPMGGELIMNRVRSLVLDSSNSIKDLRIRQFMIDCRPHLISNYRLRPDEVFGLDEQLPDPLLIV